MARARETLNRLAAGLGRGAGGLAGAVGRLRRHLPSRVVVVPVVIAVWVLSGFYVVDPGQRGAVYLFGRLDRVSEPGFHYHLPRPIEKVQACDAERIRRYVIGSRDAAAGPEEGGSAPPGDTLFLTADERLILAELVVQARVSSVTDYLSNLELPEKTVQNAALAALSSVMGRTGFDAALIETQQPGVEAQIGELLQGLLDSYRSGIQVVAAKLTRVRPPDPVREAFAQVALARERQRQSAAEALTYENDILPRARGEAARIVKEAESFKLQRVSQARGDADRFLANLDAYRQAKEVTRKRLYLETAEQVVGRAGKVVVASEKQMLWPPMRLEDLAQAADSDSPAGQQEHK